MVYSFPKKELENREIRLFLADLAHMNSKHLPGIEFVGARRVKPAPTRQQSEEKKFCLVIVDCATPEAANKVIIRGIIFRRALLTAELFDREVIIKQCFRCQQYSHIAKRCKAEHPACRECGNEHKTRDHKPGEHIGGPRCVNYRSQDHNVWFSKCSARNRELERIRKRLTARPTQYREYKREALTSSVVGLTLKPDGHTRIEKQLKR